MATESETRGKDIWDKFQIIAEIVIAIVALVFTILFSIREQESTKANIRLAESNLKIAEAQKKISEEQLKSALLPSLSSSDPKQRAIAMHLAKALDEAFAAIVVGVLASNDPDTNVRKNARSTLVILSQSQQPEVKQSAERSISRQDVASELRNRGLLTELNNAQGYLDSGNPSDKEKALQIYRKVVSQLSPDSRKKLDQRLLAEAENDYKEGHNDDSIRKYRALFAVYRHAGLEE